MLKVRWLGMPGWTTVDSAGAWLRRRQYEKASPDRRAAEKKQAEPTATSWNKVKAAKREKHRESEEGAEPTQARF